MYDMKNGGKPSTQLVWPAGSGWNTACVVAGMDYEKSLLSLWSADVERRTNPGTVEYKKKVNDAGLAVA